MQLAALAALLSASHATAQTVPSRSAFTHMSDQARERLITRLTAHPPYITRKRLPRGYELGRCLLKVDGRTLISGKCAYSISKGGGFELDGPRQIYADVDFPGEDFPQGLSTDYFVVVNREVHARGPDGPGWDAFWNEDKRASHAQGHLGTVTRKGPCYWNATAKICLWKK
ncbi:hypothetical protein BH09PSE4_BH09PSE4_07230 [soil metagenome]